MSRLMLDTSGYAALKRAVPGALEAVQVHTEILIPAVVIGELWSGFAAGSRERENRQELERLLESPRVGVVEIGSEAADRYARIYARLRACGRPIPTNDLWIAASAMEHGARLLTMDGHFLHVTEIVVEHLRA